MENQTKLVRLPINLGLTVQEILKAKYNIEPRQDSIEKNAVLFNNDNLELITRLEINKPTPGCLNGIELLPNLKRLEVRSKKFNVLNNQTQINTIIDKDAEKISKCKSLRKLSIINQPGISHIDVSELNNVLNLEISNNQNLKEVTGLKQLEKIQILNCYGNNVLGQIDGLDTFIVKSKKLQKLYLDVQQFPNAIGYNYVSGKYNTTVLKKIDKIKETCWKELVFNNSSIEINTKQMLQMHNKAYKIVERNIPQTSDRTNTILGIENYIAQNIKYDNNDSMYSKYEASGTYNAIKLNKCIDNGYTNGMRYLLKLKGINSHNITCSNTEPGRKGHHSIICIDDFGSLYADPCYNAEKYNNGDTSMPWLLKTQEEVQKNYHLSFAEIKIDNFVEQPKPVIEQKTITESKPTVEPVIRFVKSEDMNQTCSNTNSSNNVFKKYDYSNIKENNQQTDLIVMKGRKWFIKIYTFIKKAIQSFEQN